jgi:hypothetical protein
MITVRRVIGGIRVGACASAAASVLLAAGIARAMDTAAPGSADQPGASAPAEVGPATPPRQRRSRADACREPVPDPGPDADTAEDTGPEEPDDPEWIDRFQQGVYTGVCGAANWFDGLFGTPRFDQDSNDDLWPCWPVRDLG